MKRAERNKKLVANFKPENSYENLDSVTVNLSKSFKSKDLNTIDVGTNKFKFDDSLELELPNYKLLHYNNI